MRARGTLEGYLSLTCPSFTFNETGEYSCHLRMPKGPEAIETITAIDDLMVQAKAKNKVKDTKIFIPYEIDCNTLVLKFKAPGVRWFGGQTVTYNLPIVGEDALPSDDFNDITEGSVVTIDYTPKAWSAQFGYGVSLQMNGIMVHDLVHFFGREPGIPDVTSKY